MANTFENMGLQRTVAGHLVNNYRVPMDGVHVRAGWSTNMTDGKRVMRLTIEDCASSEEIVELTLDSSQVTELLAGGGIYAQPRKSLTDVSWERVGRLMENDTFPVPDDVVPINERDTRVCYSIVREWAMVQPWADDWDVFEPHKSNRGWLVTARRWRPIENAEPYITLTKEEN